MISDCPENKTLPPLVVQTSTTYTSFPSSVSIFCLLWKIYICCGSILSLVQIFFSFVLGMVMYNNNMIMSLKQKKRKFEPQRTRKRLSVICFVFIPKFPSSFKVRFREGHTFSLPHALDRSVHCQFSQKGQPVITS